MIKIGDAVLELASAEKEIDELRGQLKKAEANTEYYCHRNLTYANEIDRLITQLEQFQVSHGHCFDRGVELQRENAELKLRLEQAQEEKEKSDKLIRNSFYDQLSLLHENSSLKHEIEILKSK